MSNSSVSLPKLSFGQAVLNCFSKYATFKGRARRSEFWFFYLFNVLVYIWLYIIILVAVSQKINSLIILGIVLFWVFCLGALIPTIAAVVRRLHDIGRSGWWFFIGLVPLIGAIVLLVFECTDSQPEENE